MPSSKSSSKPRPSQLAASHEWEFTAIGTQWWIGLYEPVTEQVFEQLKQQIQARIEIFDQTYSRFRPDSVVTQMSQKAGVYNLPKDSIRLLATYRSLYEMSGGAVTPLVGQVLADAGYDATYSLRPSAMTPAPKWDDVMAVNSNVVTIKQPVLLDFGAAGKGYLVDIVSDLLRDAGINAFCVDAGGDMYCHGLENLMKIGLEHPDDLTQIVGVAQITNGALCGSAGNRRAWAGYHHIMDPQLLQSPEAIKAVWTYASDCLTADCLSTALFFVSPIELQKQYSFEYCIVFADDSVEQSNNFPAKLFSEREV